MLSVLVKKKFTTERYSQGKFNSRQGSVKIKSW